MLTPEQIYRTLVGLAAQNDADVLAVLVRQHPDQFPPEHLDALLAMARLVEALLRNYSYEGSSAFARECEGKSQAFVAMRTKLENSPERRAERRQQFIHALRQLPQERRVDALVPVASLAAFNELCCRVEQLKS